jgi:hypothetical protein
VKSCATASGSGGVGFSETSAVLADVALADIGGPSAGSRRSSNGFCWISASTNCVSSRFDSCSILIACCSCGVITKVCAWRSSSRCE